MSRHLLVALFAAGALPFLAVAAPLQTSEPVVLYDAPSSKALPLLILAGGSPLKEISRVDGWYKVSSYGNDIGWVSTESVRQQRAAVVIAGRAAVRVDPHPAAETIFFAQRGVIVEVLQPAVGNGWMKVLHSDGEVGYLQKSDSWQNF